MIIDTLDQCPTQAETVNGFQDSDGCPDVVPIKDSDNDGIFDDYDECPTQSETMNNYLDSDGCPDITQVNDSKSEPEQDNSLLQWTAVIAALITAAGAVGAAKFKKPS